MTQSFSMRKIPIYEITQKEFDVDIDKIKILELCNSIDKWEQEVLFSQNGFYSLKGKKIENKTKEFLVELENFVNFQISKIKFKNEASYESVKKIKNKKLKAIEEQMHIYEEEQLQEWINTVYENSIQSCIQRALLYKDIPEIVNSSYKNGMAILTVMSERELWNAKLYKIKKENFSSIFFFKLISAFISDKDVKASLYFEQYAEQIQEKDRKKLEKNLKNFKNNVIAFNWAKELFSYDLSEEENDTEITKIKDEEIKKHIKHYVSVFKSEKKKNDEFLNNDKNEKNWKEIIDVLNSEPNKAELYIDFSLSKETQQAKKEYIRQIQEKGYIETDIKKFFLLLKKIRKNFDEFKLDSLSDYRANLSSEDYETIKKISSYTNDEYNLFISDFDYISLKLKEKNLFNEKEIYVLIKFLFSSQIIFLKNEKKGPDIEKRNKLIDAALERCSVKVCEHK